MKKMFNLKTLILISVLYTGAVSAQDNSHSGAQINLPYNSIFQGVDKGDLNRDASWRDKVMKRRAEERQVQRQQSSYQNTPLQPQGNYQPQQQYAPAYNQRQPAAVPAYNGPYTDAPLLQKAPLNSGVIEQKANKAQQFSNESRGYQKQYDKPDFSDRVSYFVELRADAPQNINLFSEPNRRAVRLGTLKRGQIIRVTSTPKQYANEKRAEYNNVGFWRGLEGQAANKTQKLFLYQFWREMKTLNPYEPVKLSAKVPAGRKQIAVFSKPGKYNWKDCGQIYDTCTAYIDEYTDIKLLESKFHEMSARNGARSWELYYKIKFEYVEKNGRAKFGQGWVHADHAQRKFDGFEFNVYRFSRSPASGLRTRLGEFDEKDFYTFSRNVENPSIYKNRYMNETRIEDVRLKGSLFDVNFAMDTIAKLDYVALQQEQLEVDLSQFGVALGGRIGVPLFLDLDLEASVTLSIPIAGEDNSGKGRDTSYFLEADQWLNFTVPARVGDFAIKWGVGGYYYLQTKDRDEFGFSSLSGFQTRILAESSRMWGGFKITPLGSDLRFDLNNSQLGLSFGYRINPKKEYESWAVTADIKSAKIIPNEENGEEKELAIQNIQIGIIWPF